ncbi:hypothetical protein FOC4_g10013004 [Fusarium odoratissimum]|uniref:Uncharacterized protein n=2 Tax=Fusarium oxysporum species complex TaxID=171631 RepID=N1RWK2_FUSC4|nr:hypothetical protein FOC4_g10013004 [Fusarium odoratissimum]TXC07517.1 hypothetical protein FocTR4_00003104 [Fusarium oxysporum f. sp. cubense]
MSPSRTFSEGCNRLVDFFYFISTGPIKSENESSKARNTVNDALFTIDQRTTHGNTSRAIRHKKSKTLLRLNERIG